MGNPADIVIASARHPADDEEIRALFVEYAESLGFSLGYQGFEAELAELPGKYAPPTGALLLARADGAAAGTVALRQLTQEICEMKRLYVRPAYRGLRTGEGLSIGRALALAIVAEARALGYRRLRLDTITGKMDAAMRLYKSLGFVEIPPYYPSPVPGTAYMERVL
ncbi:MAG TPA: GNAT family N-acetyltransferase [Archangium sp.]